MVADGLQGVFGTLDVTQFRRTLAKFHEAVGCGRGRIEVTRRGCEDNCVLISKAELEALERALEILCESAEYKSMCDNISQLVAACSNCDDTGKPRDAGPVAS